MRRTIGRMFFEKKSSKDVIGNRTRRSRQHLFWLSNLAMALSCFCVKIKTNINNQLNIKKLKQI